MGGDAEYRAFLRDLFAGVGPITIRRMFGGLGLWSGDAMFALVAGGTLYMKTDAALARAYAAEGSAPFTYEGGGRRVEMSYWRLPESALDDPDEAAAWARRSLVPAEAAAAEKRAKKLRKEPRGV